MPVATHSSTCEVPAPEKSIESLMIILLSTELSWWGVGVFSDMKSLGAVAASQQPFLSLAPIQANTRGGGQNMQGIGC